MKFDNYADLTEELVERTVAAIAERPEFEIKRGFSNQSCSAYVNVMFMERDEDGDYIDAFGDCKVRFSDHADRYGSDLSIQFNNALDEDDMNNVVLDDWRMDEMVKEAVTFINEQFAEQSA